MCYAEGGSNCVARTPSDPFLLRVLVGLILLDLGLQQDRPLTYPDENLFSAATYGPFQSL